MRLSRSRRRCSKASRSRSSSRQRRNASRIAAASFAEATAVVEQVALVAASRQRLEFELAVDVEQVLAERAQRLHRHGLAVDVSATASVGGDAPSQDDFTFVRDFLFREPGQRTGVARDVEGCGHFGPLGTVAHRAAVGATTHGEQQRVDEDRFSRAGLAGERREARSELELHGLDDREIANLQLAQHRAASGDRAGRCDRRGPSAASSAGCGSSRGPADAAAWRRSRRRRRAAAPRARGRRAPCRRRRPGRGPRSGPRARSRRRCRRPTTIGRSDSVCGQIGTSTMAARLGCTIGPPHESA